MVVWELTAITAYFLGLKRTYRLALRVQRRLIGPNHPRIRDFVYRRTRDVFGVAVPVHKNIQQRDLEVGRNLGNTILRWLDRMKPSAEIRSRPPDPPNGSSERFRNLSSTSRSSEDLLQNLPTRFRWQDVVLAPEPSAKVLPGSAYHDGINSSSQRQLISYPPFPPRRGGF